MDKTLKTILEKEVGHKVIWNDNFMVYALNLGSRSEAEKIAGSKKIKEYFATEIIEKNGRVFLNFCPNEKGMEHGLKLALKKKFNFKPKSLRNRPRTQIEFISANPTGELHVGHGRGGFLGDVLSNILEKSGHKVTREYYINDSKQSNQIKELGKTVLGKGESYLTDYLKNKILNYRSSTSIVEEAGYLVAQEIQKDNKKFIEDGLKIKFDSWFFEEKDLREKSYFKKAEKALKNYIYKKDGAFWFKSSEFGGTEDNVVIRSDGSPGYFLSNVAYFFYHFTKKNFDKMIFIWGADHQEEVKRMLAIKKILGWNGELDILISQLVTIKEAGEKKKLSKRKGTVVLLKDLLEDVGLDALRWFFLSKSLDTHMDFDLELAKEQSKKNPVYYVQYAGARMSSILEKSGSLSQNFLTISPLARSFRQKSKNFDPAHKYERALILKLAQMPEVLEGIAKDCQVHHLASYVYELAKSFTDFYENVRVLEAENEELKKSRLELVFISRQILEKVLFLMGIAAPERM
ncbi:arginine--tRNA ligase [Patescibacteria group bacterium]|nr:arginine--tRNA ligase [Patescibacteria group bacterium]